MKLRTQISRAWMKRERLAQASRPHGHLRARAAVDSLKVRLLTMSRRRRQADPRKMQTRPRNARTMNPSQRMLISLTLRRPPQMISHSPRARSDLAQVRSLSLTFLVDLFPFPSAPERILGQLLARHSRLFRAFPLRASKEKSSHHLSFHKKKSCVIWRI